MYFVLLLGYVEIKCESGLPHFCLRVYSHLSCLVQWNSRSFLFLVRIILAGVKLYVCERNRFILRAYLANKKTLNLTCLIVTRTNKIQMYQHVAIFDFSPLFIFVYILDG